MDDKTTIEPKRGHRVTLDVKSTFTIPAGKNNILLPIFQGQGKNIKRFSLALEHSSLPLSQDIDCTLDLGYTYGDEEPYQLIFNPIDEGAPFNQVIARWSDWIMTQEQKLVCPEYPSKKSVEQLGEGGKRSIVIWAEEIFKEINSLYIYYTQGSCSQHIYFDAKNVYFKKDKNNKYFSTVYIDNERIFLHENNYHRDTFREDFTSFAGYKEASKNGNGYVLKNIFKEHRLSNLWYLPILILFDQARSIFDKDFPENLKLQAESALEQALELLKQHKIPEVLTKDIKQFIYYFHKDIPASMGNILLEKAKKNLTLKNNYLKYSYVIGNCSTPWQQAVLKVVLKSIDDQNSQEIMFLILGTAIWRSESIVHQLDSKQINNLVNRLPAYLVNRLPAYLVFDELKDTSVILRLKWNNLLRLLELVFALLRLRESGNAQIAHSMEVGSANSDKLLNAVQIVDNQLGSMLFNVMQRDNKVKCRVHLDNINKPESYNKTPDILYALNMYLSGDDGANSISIREISSE